MSDDAIVYEQLDGQKADYWKSPRHDDGDVIVANPDGPDPEFVVFNEGGYNSTTIRVSEVLEWLRKRRPDLL